MAATQPQKRRISIAAVVLLTWLYILVDFRYLLFNNSSHNVIRTTASVSFVPPSSVTQQCEQYVKTHFHFEDKFYMFNCGIAKVNETTMVAMCRVSNLHKCTLLADGYKRTFSFVAVTYIDTQTLTSQSDWVVFDAAVNTGPTRIGGVEMPTTTKESLCPRFYGMEDVRPFYYNNELYGIGTYNNENCLPQMALIKFNTANQLNMQSVKPLTQSIQSAQKNWSPIILNNSLYLITDIHKFMRIVSVNITTGMCTEVSNTVAPPDVRKVRAGRHICDLDKVDGNFNGISLGLAHVKSDHWMGFTPMYEFVFFLYTKSDLKILEFSPSYSIPSSSTFFLYPHHATQQGNEIIMSFGVDNCSIRLVKIPLNEALKEFKTLYANSTVTRSFNTK